jgi:hypothetical protein
MARIPAAILVFCLLALAGCSGNGSGDHDATPPGPMGIEGRY